jgi:hypothetical protein
MKRAFLVTLLAITLTNLYAQEDVAALFVNWEDPAYSQARTSKEVSYLTSKEAELLRLINLLRLNPKLYASTYLRYYSETKDSVKTRAISASLSAFNEMPGPCLPLHPTEGLQRSALQEIELLIQNQSSNGSLPYYERISQFFPGAKKYASQSLEGDGEPILILNRLLTDSISNYRRHILSHNLHFIGVAIVPDAERCYRVVIDFASQPQPPLPQQTKRKIKHQDYADKCPDKVKIIKPKKRRKHKFLGIF